MLDWLDHKWRLLATGISFLAFGIGGLILSVLIFPCLHLISNNRDTAQRRCRFMVHYSFALFVWLMKNLGVLTYQFSGSEFLQGPGKLIVANHPSLIDVVFIIAQIPDAFCIVKKAAWKNPVMFGVMQATGFIANDGGDHLISACVQILREGKTLVLFPEGTRTTPGKDMRFQRGATIISLLAQTPLTPIHVDCVPTTLTKGEKWYQIPSSRPHFTLSVGAPVILGIL